MQTNQVLEIQRNIWKKRHIKRSSQAVPLLDGLRNVPLDDVDMGQVACVILAGGMASRLGCEGPKGNVNVGRYGKSLFDILISKAQDMPVAVMTSPINNAATKLALQSTHAEMFQQDMMPFLDDEGEWILEDGVPLMGPDGNGGVFACLERCGILPQWEKQGIRYLTVLPIDNPKANPKNIQQITLLRDCDLVVTAISRESPDEPIGVLADLDGKLHVREYTEGSCEGLLGYSGLFSCTLDFARRVSGVDLPWHLARKSVHERNIWKCERFIFDLFPYANSYKVLIEARSKCFDPIKRKEDL